VSLADASALILYAGDWRAYVAKMNSEAERWLEQPRLGEGQGYLLMSASEIEFASLINNKK
jgi:hypothetical protein